ncbi:hypothetical protein SAMN05892883_2064 [Jatrophihabitans sp. GAS493]|uniref:hypothetical protein n=1 Tax=Jatrophihabitans sp. GAS493 TaxID=1907575 RepID=UPI000BB90A4B|nr:hypothetical protein [Jatrophihabitans sp. GAS493]SOD72714.1 hypothetical protein SAMN05892883_2064 [Jatrophihabitans sp. GAS493]
MSTTAVHGIRKAAGGDAPTIANAMLGFDDVDVLLPVYTATDPGASGKQGLIWVNATTGSIQVSDGTSWVTVWGGVKRLVGGGFIVGAAWDGVSQLIQFDATAVVTVSAANWQVNLPTAFPNGLLSVQLTLGDAASPAGTVTNLDLVVSSCTLGRLVGQAWVKDGSVPPNGNYRINISALGW